MRYAPPRVPPHQAARPSRAEPIVDDASTIYDNIARNRLFMRTCYAIAIGVFGAWSFSDRGLLYQMYDKLEREQGAAIQNATGLKLPHLPSTTRLTAVLRKYFLLHADEPYNFAAWIGSAFSHTDPVHFMFNILTWSSFAPAIFHLPTVHVVGLTLGSAVVAAGSWMVSQRGGGPSNRMNNNYAQGSSGIVSGLLTTVTMFSPLARARVMFIIPMPLVGMTGLYFLMDSVLMANNASTGIAHAAHLGGGVFGILYYTVFLRRFGGILGR